ncbi:MAG: CHAT domain-containing protein [Okeania sp. SIO3B5]|uniref:CHAT domain-containing protein n=1 Tax=Okeania sp. SIO3B5 TaxID=2607811 RepID=UPI0013FF41FE|nr:CHAT domain-containing protein [Okeania sp. SIO3B5]NEO56027.1 CHAT domain-containing protein [Okeania sp. SIO3B5]
MEEEFIDLIKQLLTCNNWEEVNQVLNSNQQLIVPKLLPLLTEAAEDLAGNGDFERGNFLLHLTLRLGEFLGSSQMSSTTRKETAYILLQIGIRWHQINLFSFAIKAWQQVLVIYSQTKDRQGQVISFGNLGLAYNSLEQYEQAIYFFQQSLQIARQIRNSQGQVYSLGCLGNAYHSLGEYEQAVKFHQQSLEIARQIKHRQGEARSLHNLGNVYHSLGQYEQTVEFLQQSLVITQEIKDPQGQANSLNDLGVAYRFLGKYEQAVEFLQQSLVIKQKIRDSRGQVNSLGHLGMAYYFLGQHEGAIEFFQQSLQIARQIRNSQGQANSLGSLGLVYHSLGEYEQSIDFYQQSLQIARRIKYRKGEASFLDSLGIAYYSIGQYQQAIDFHQQSLDIARQIKYHQGEVSSLGNLGSVYRSLKQYQKAIDFHQQSLEIAREIKDSQGEVSSLGNLGSAYHFLGEYQRAIDFHQQSLEIARQIKYRKGEARSLANLAITYRSLGEYKQAITNFQDSLKIASSKIMPTEYARTAIDLGNLHFTQENWENAVLAYTKAIETTEMLRTRGKTDDRRQEVIKNVIGVYAKTIECFVNTGQCSEALTYAEQSRNRQLVDLMYSKDVYYRGETPPEVAKLLQQYEEIQQQLDNVRFNNEPLNNHQEVSKYRQMGLSYQENNDIVTSLEAQKQEIYSQIRKLDRVLAEGLAVKPLKFAQLQNLVRDSPTTAIVSFYSIYEDTYTFILVGNSVDLHRCGQGYEMQVWLRKNWFQPYTWYSLPESDRPPLSKIAAAKLLKCDVSIIEDVEIEIDATVVLFKDGTSKSVEESEFDKLCEQLMPTYLFWNEQMPSKLKEISQRLQLDKLVEKLTGIQELIIIPHLYLHQIPFAALPLADNQYLGDKFLIRTQSSCQTLDFCTQRPPISTQTPAYGIVEDTQEDLPCSSFEAQKVAQIYNVATDKYLQGTTATVSTYKQLLQQVQGLLSSHHAKSRFDNSLESELILADGRITLSDLLSPAFRFPDLDEVFLSACETNLGTTEITDDTMTLNTGFLCAGARGVISSLWAVDDLATSLFSLFYHQKRKAGLNRPQALQKAQQDLRHLTGKEFEREYYGELEGLLNEKLQLASQKKAAAKQERDGCAEDAPEYEQLQAEYEKREWLEERILKTRDIRLKAVCEQEHPFEHPEYWSGFICAGLR